MTQVLPTFTCGFTLCVEAAAATLRGVTWAERAAVGGMVGEVCIKGVVGIIGLIGMVCLVGKVGLVRIVDMVGKVGLVRIVDLAGIGDIIGGLEIIGVIGVTSLCGLETCVGVLVTS